MADAEQDESNAYELLELEITATEADIRKSYRRKSLQVHPDRHPNNPQAAQKFHELNAAYELLLDPIRRTALDLKVKALQAKKIRYASYDSKRKAMMDELEKSEREFKKFKTNELVAKDARTREEERIKEEGRQLMKQRQEALNAQSRHLNSDPKGKANGDPGPASGSLDNIVRLKYSTTDHPTLVTTEALSALLRQFGDIDLASVVLTIKPNKKNPSKVGRHAVALIPFISLDGAFAAVTASNQVEKGLGGVQISWAGNKEPERVLWLRERGQLGLPAQTETGLPRRKRESVQSTPSLKVPFSSFPGELEFSPDVDPAQAARVATGIDLESLTFMRMREAERYRLEREILEAESRDG